MVNPLSRIPLGTLVVQTVDVTVHVTSDVLCD